MVLALHQFLWDLIIIPKSLLVQWFPPIHGDTSLLDSPEKWKGKSLEEIVNFRLSLVRGIQKVSIDQTEGRYIENLQEVTMSSKPTDSDLIFEKLQLLQIFPLMVKVLLLDQLEK